MGTPFVPEEKPVQSSEEQKENVNLWDNAAQPKTESQPEAEKPAEVVEGPKQ